ncbi:MAG: rod shape-determining protein MreD [bacterium]|nr:rod shape-determining protein MreD [bacterium]
MRFIKYIIVYLILLFVEKKFLDLISIKDVTPDIILIFVIIISLREERLRSTFIGFFAGLIQDAFTTAFFGLSALAKSIVGFWGNFFQQPKKKYTIAYYMMICLVLVSVHEFIYQVIQKMGSNIHFFSLILFYIIPKIMYTLVFAAIAYLIFGPAIWRARSTADRLI